MRAVLPLAIGVVALTVNAACDSQIVLPTATPKRAGLEFAAAAVATPTPSRSPTPTAAPTRTPTPTAVLTTPTPSPTPIEDLDCVDFATWADALRFFVAAGGPELDVHHLDIDGDGVPCETLSGAPQLRATPTATAGPDLAPSPTPDEAGTGTLPLNQGSSTSDNTPPAAPPISTPTHPSPTRTPTPSPPAPPPTPTPALPLGQGDAPTPTPVSAASPTPPPTPTPQLLYDPFGEDRNCSDFPTWQQAYDFFVAAGGPGADPHRLDGDDDGIPCESLPGAPKPE